MPDILEATRGEITRRLNELRPLLEEYDRLQAAAKALDEINPGDAGKQSSAAPRRRRGRPPGSGRKATANATSTRAAKAGRPAKANRPARKRRVGRRKGSGTRAAQALAAVKGQPGITIKELAAKMGISANYLYRVMPGLEREKKVTQKGPAGTRSRKGRPSSA